MPTALAFVGTAGWGPTIETIVLCLALDVVTAYIVEPVWIGTHTGISSLALLISAMFWTWLWGPVGLILSTPFTVCLATLGKHVKGMEFLAVLLGDEPPLEASLTFYQRLLAGDEVEATEIIDQELKIRPRAAVFDDILTPTVVRAGRDHLSGDISAEEEKFVVRTIDDLLQQQVEGQDVSTPQDPSNGPRRILGVPARNEADELGLKMLGQVLGAGWSLETLTTATLASELLLAITNMKPDVLCISSFPPGGFSHARYLCKRIHNQFPALPIWLLRCDSGDEVEKSSEQLARDGAQQVATSFSIAVTQLQRFVFAPTDATAGAAESQQVASGLEGASTVARLVQIA
jgi:hypothetical protein